MVILIKMTKYKDKGKGKKDNKIMMIWIIERIIMIFYLLLVLIFKMLVLMLVLLSRSKITLKLKKVQQKEG